MTQNGPHHVPDRQGEKMGARDLHVQLSFPILPLRKLFQIIPSFSSAKLLKISLKFGFYLKIFNLIFLNFLIFFKI